MLFKSVGKNVARPKVIKIETLNLNVLPGDNAFSYLVVLCKTLFLTSYFSESTKVSSVRPK